jgi:hypothetical protein
MSFSKVSGLYNSHSGLKVTRCSKNNFRIGKQANIWDNGDTWDNATWASSKLKCKAVRDF